MPSFTFNALFSTPYSEGSSGTSSLVPSLADIGLAGHAYVIDWSAPTPLSHTSVPLLRQQQDTSETPGEQSINPEGLWRRFGESWHLGAGQERFDRKDSSPYRFHESQGFDIWTKYGLSLLKDTDEKVSDAGTNLRLAVAGDYLYMVLGNAIKYTLDVSVDVPVLTNVTGVPATDATSIASNGNRVWTAHGTNGVYMTVKGTATTASHITGNVSLIAYVKNRVMGAYLNSIYDLTALAIGAGGALPAALFTHGNTDFQWVGFAESQGFIYAAGYSGDKSLIYGITITAEGSALGAPTVVGTLPDGEVVSSVYGYLGRFLVLGSNKGFRLAVVGGDGSLTLGSLIETTSSVLAFEGQEEFVWYGLTNYSSSVTGLGRMSTALFSDLDNLVPAYASDLMVTSQGAVLSIVTFQGLRVFTISGIGVYAEHLTRLVATGSLDTGQISYNLTELKTALWLNLQYDNNGGSNGAIEPLFSTDDGPFGSLGAYSTNGDLPTFAVGEAIGFEFEIRLTADRDSVNSALGPTILSWLLRSQPRPTVTSMIFVTILIAPIVSTSHGVDLVYKPLDELEFIEGLNETKEIVTLQESNASYPVSVEDYEANFKRIIQTEGMSGFNGSILLKLKRA